MKSLQVVFGKATAWVAKRGAWGIAVVVTVSVVVLLSGVGATMAATGNFPFQAKAGLPEASAGGTSGPDTSGGGATGSAPAKSQEPPVLPIEGIPSSMWGDRAAKFSGLKITSDSNGIYVSFGGELTSTSSTYTVSFNGSSFGGGGTMSGLKVGEQYNSIAVYPFKLLNGTTLPELCRSGKTSVSFAFRITGLAGVSTASYEVPLSHYTCPVTVPSSAPSPPNPGNIPPAPSPVATTPQPVYSPAPNITPGTPLSSSLTTPAP